MSEISILEKIKTKHKKCCQPESTEIYKCVPFAKLQFQYKYKQYKEKYLVKILPMAYKKQ